MINISKKDKENIKNGALIGLVGGALIGVPVVGALAGGIIGGNYKDMKKKKKNNDFMKKFY